MAGTADEAADSRHWDKFARRHRGNSLLQWDFLYSLNEPIIDAIKSEVPDFFLPAQEQFERDLARSASCGFFYRRAYGIARSEEDSQRRRQARVTNAIDEILRTECLRLGASEEDIRVSITAGRERHEAIEARKSAYVGWLVTNRLFRQEVGTLRAAWETQVCELRRFPRFPRWPFHDLALGVEVPEDFANDLLVFYARWGLQQMLTWEWPIPLEPDLDSRMLSDADLTREAGVRVFLPWYLLRGEKLDLQEFVRRNRATDSPPHLRAWVQKVRGKRDELGDVRYERLAWLYRFLELALRQRYPDACRRRAQALDVAFSRVLGRDEESVRKLRLQLQRSFR